MPARGGAAPETGGVDVDGGDDAVALSAAFVGFVVDPGGFFR